LINDLQTLSDRVGIPALAKVKLADSLETRPLKLQVLLDFYLKNNPSVKDELKDVKASFLQFMQLVGKETVEEIRDADLYGYDDSLKRINEKRELPNSRYVNKRFARVRTVFNFYNNNFKRINKSDNPHEDCIVKVMKDFTAICVKLAEQIITQDPPKDFAPKIFKQMMQVEPDEMYKLIYCLTLACGFYAKDIEGLTKSMIKTKNDIVYIDYPREKTKRVHNRLIVLPQIVADKLTAYIASDKTESDFIFKNQQKANLKRQSIWDHFDLLRKTITHDDGTEISFKHLRDTTASTLAFAVTNVNFINITIGHRAVKSEYWKYIRTNQEQHKEVPKIMYEKFKDGFDLL
jgi:integrase